MDLLIETIDGLSLSVSQTGLSSGIGGVVWDCALVLSKVLLVPEFQSALHNRLLAVCDLEPSSAESFRQFKAFELGSGTGLLGMQLAMLGFQVVMTDLPSVIPQLLINLSQNAQLLEDCSLLTDVYVWGQELPQHHFPVQLLVLSDCLYAFEYIDLLAESLENIFVSKGYSPLVLHAYENRHDSIPQEFFQRVGHFLSWEEILISEFLPNEQLPEDVHLVLMWRKSQS